LNLNWKLWHRFLKIKKIVQSVQYFLWNYKPPSKMSKNTTFQQVDNYSLWLAEKCPNSKPDVPKTVSCKQKHMYLLAKILMTILNKILTRILCIKEKCADNLALQFKIVFIGLKKCVHVDMSKSLNQRRLCLENDGTRYQISLAVVLRNEIHDISIFLNDITKRHQSFKWKLQKAALFVEFFLTIPVKIIILTSFQNW